MVYGILYQLDKNIVISMLKTFEKSVTFSHKNAQDFFERQLN